MKGRPQILPKGNRPDVDLRTSRALLPGTQLKRTKFVWLFAVWLADTAAMGLENFLASAAEFIDISLASYGQALYTAGNPMGQLIDTILGIVDLRRSLRHALPSAWDVVRSWKLLLPIRNHVPAPLPVVLAMFALAVTWGWWDVGLTVALSFECMLRPGEAKRLRPCDILLPSQLMICPAALMYVKIGSPKMRRVSARREHVACDCTALVRLCELLLPRLQQQKTILCCDVRDYRKAHDFLVSFFGIAAKDGVGLTPASHRGGGATHRFRMGVDLERIKWHGRWQSSKTLEVYIQEVAASSILPGLSQLQRDVIQDFAHAAPLLLANWEQALRRPV